MMWGWRSRLRYWIWPVSAASTGGRTSRCTRFDISAVEILRLLMNFIATLRPVSVCLATVGQRRRAELRVRFTLPNEPWPRVEMTS